MKKSTAMFWLIVGVLVLVIILALILVLFLSSVDTEIEIGIIIVIAVVALMLLLFIMAAGFNILNLSDAKQALGLPEGSIRAMIALILVLVFIICGTYLFRLVGTGYPNTLTNRTSDDLQKIQGKVLHVMPNPKNPENFDVIVQSDLTPDAVKLAQQLTTTIGTLVVAVAGFYFGSTTVSSAVSADRSRHASQPSLQSIDPTGADPGQDISLKIAGSDLNRTQKVRLVRGNEEMVGTQLMSNPTTIQSKFTIDKQPGDKWDVVVSTDDGAEARLREAFEIKAAPGTDKNSGASQPTPSPVDSKKTA
jgi:hypothetical protein